MLVLEHALTHIQSFSSLLSSIGGKSQAPQPSSGTGKSTPSAQNAVKSLSSAEVAKPSSSHVPAGLKRKREEDDIVVNSKASKINSEQKLKPGSVAGRPAYTLTTARLNVNVPATSYQGTAKQSGSLPSVKGTPQTSQPFKANDPGKPPAAGDKSGQPAPKRGFASIMEKAKAAQQLAKTSGSTGIKHKPVLKLSKRDRLRMMEEAKKIPRKRENGHTRDRNRGGSTVDSKSIVRTKGTETTYKGTMKKLAPEMSYKGTMRTGGSGEGRQKATAKKDLGQDKYGGYASWSDLDEVQDEEEDYESDASSVMEEGFDDMEREEQAALRAARKEDQEALKEEERLKQEKLQRKKKLQELNKVAAGKKKF